MPCPAQLLGDARTVSRMPKTDDPVDVIRHNHMRRQLDDRKVAGDLPPAFVNESAERIQEHLAPFDVAEDAFFSNGTDGNEIEVRLCVVEERKPNRATTREGRVALHGWGL